MRRHLMLRTLHFFNVEYGIARFLCAIRVFEVRASPSSTRLLSCQISFLSRFPLLSEPLEKNGVVTHPLNYSAYLMPREPKLSLRNKQRDWLSPMSEAKAPGWLQSAVTITHAIFFIVECGVARILCAMRVFEVRNHPDPLCYLCATFRFVHGLRCEELTHGEKSRNHSITKLI